MHIPLDGWPLRKHLEIRRYILISGGRILKPGAALPSHGSPHFFPFEHEPGERVTVYNPYRVLRQFRHEQGIVRVRGDTSYSNDLIAERRFKTRYVGEPAQSPKIIFRGQEEKGLSLHEEYSSRPNVFNQWKICSR